MKIVRVKAGLESEKYDIRLIFIWVIVVSIVSYLSFIMMHLKTFSILWFFQVRCNAFFLRCAGHSCRPRLVVIVCKTECQDQTEERFPSQSHKIRDSQNCSPWIVLSGWLLGVAAAAVDAWWEQPQRQNSFFVGPDSSGIGQLLSDPVEHITCRVETVLTIAANEPSRVSVSNDA